MRRALLLGLAVSGCLDFDSAVGECFDKTAKLLGLGFPGGPAVERAAKGGDPQRFAMPRPMWRKPGCDFSFSGLKTAVRQTVEKLDAILSKQMPDAEKRRRADFVVDTSHGLDPVRAQIKHILAEVVKMPRRRA